MSDTRTIQITAGFVLAELLAERPITVNRRVPPTYAERCSARALS